tara:strand:+ start:1534 stop:1938 length:405 start_codon:yes stop_codon:yes gene_type:complete
MKATRMQAHIERIANDNGIKIIPSKSNRGWACKEENYIEIPAVKSPTTYALALHELGHCLGKRQSETRLKSEIGAWEWALENAFFWKPSMTKKMRRGLESYVRKFTRVKYANDPTPAEIRLIEELCTINSFIRK